MASSTDKPIMVPVDHVRPNEWNPNAMKPETLAATVENVRRFGFNGSILVRPIDDPTVDAKYEIVDGEHRYRAALELGIKQIPVTVREFTDGEAKSQTLAMNQLRGEMPAEDVARLVREIEESGISRDDLTSFSGYTADDLDALDAALAAGADDAKNGSGDGDGGASGAEDQSGQVGEAYHVIVDCADEAAQLALAEKLEGEGFVCRLVIG